MALDRIDPNVHSIDECRHRFGRISRNFDMITASGTISLGLLSGIIEGDGAGNFFGNCGTAQLSDWASPPSAGFIPVYTAGFWTPTDPATLFAPSSLAAGSFITTSSEAVLSNEKVLTAAAGAEVGGITFTVDTVPNPDQVRFSLTSLLNHWNVGDKRVQFYDSTSFIVSGASTMTIWAKGGAPVAHILGTSPDLSISAPTIFINGRVNFSGDTFSGGYAGGSGEFLMEGESGDTPPDGRDVRIRGGSGTNTGGDVVIQTGDGGLSHGTIQFKRNTTVLGTWGSSGLTVGSLSGFVKATAGLLSAETIEAADITDFTSAVEAIVAAPSGDICLSGTNHIGFGTCATHRIYSPAANNLYYEVPLQHSFYANSALAFHIAETNAQVYGGQFVVGHNAYVGGVELDMQTTYGTFFWRWDDAGLWQTIVGGTIMSYDSATEIMTLTANASIILQPGGSTEITLTANQLETNNGAVDMQLGWSTSGQWDFKSGGNIYASWTATGVTYEAGATDVGNDWGTSGQWAVKVAANKEFTVAANTWTFGYGATADLTLNFSANTNSGVLAWNRANDRFKFGDDIHLDNAERVYFGSSAAAYIEDYTGANLVLGINAAAATYFLFGGTLAYGFTATVLSPASGVTADLGGSTQEWRDLWLDERIRLTGFASPAWAANTHSIWVDSTDLNMRVMRPSVSANCDLMTCWKPAIASSTAIGNTAVKTYFDNSDDYTVKADKVVAGSTFEAEIWGVYSTKASGPGTLTLEWNWGTTSVISVVISVAAGAANTAFHLRVVATIRTTGASGTIAAVMPGSVRGDTVTVLNSTATIATNADKVPQFSATWSLADVANTITAHGNTFKQIW